MYMHFGGAVSHTESSLETPAFKAYKRYYVLFKVLAESGERCGNGIQSRIFSMQQGLSHDSLMQL